MVGGYSPPVHMYLRQFKTGKMYFCILLIFFMCSEFSLSYGQISEIDFDRNIFAKKLMDDYGSDGHLSLEQLESLIQKLTISRHYEDGESSKNGIHENGEPKSKNTTCKDDCLLDSCLSTKQIFTLYSGESTTVNTTQLSDLSSAVLYNLQNVECDSQKEQFSDGHTKPTAGQVWGYGFLCVTLINLCALMGMVFLPLMKKSYYHHMLMFMVALAVGTLAGSSLLFLIPECFGMTHDHSPLKDEYIFKSTIVICGIYLFFLTERFLNIIMHYRQKRNQESEPEDILSSVKSKTRHRRESMNMSFEPPHLKEGTLLSEKIEEVQPTVKVVKEGESNSVSGHSHYNIKSVAWMVIFGDGLHNFIDGLSIGAAFSGSLMTGVSVSLAVICEELPHELGDFAILLNAGMSMKQALGYNFLSACMCYLGLVIGILVGELTSGAEWIFAIAGGMFLYISLVDMLPEVNHAAEKEAEETGNQWKVFFLQNGGLVIGYMIMLILAYYGGNIEISF